VGQVVDLIAELERLVTEAHAENVRRAEQLNNLSKMITHLAITSKSAVLPDASDIDVEAMTPPPHDPNLTGGTIDLYEYCRGHLIEVRSDIGSVVSSRREIVRSLKVADRAATSARKRIEDGPKPSQMASIGASQVQGWIREIEELESDEE
jgi:hypothetical protein